MMEITDHSLIEAHKKGSVDAFEQIVHRYARSLLGYLIKMNASEDKAEDYLQETFRRAYEKLNTFRGGSFKSWLFTIATNVAVDGFRRQKKVHFLPLDENAEAEEPDCERTTVALKTNDGENPYERAAKSELAEKVKEIIAFLPAGQRKALVLSYYQQLSYPEVAQVMGCSVGAVKKQMYRALKTLADKLPDRGLL